MNRYVIMLLALCLFIGSAVDSQAHSRKGLVKTTLHSDALTVDQVAYYLEAKVNKRLDENGRKYRYTIWDFDKIETTGKLARVYVQVNDQKMAQKTPEILYLKQNPDESWNHIDENGEVITANIYTMVKPDYTQYYVMGGSAVLLCVAGTFAFLKRKKRKAAGQIA